MDIEGNQITLTNGVDEHIVKVICRFTFKGIMNGGNHKDKPDNYKDELDDYIGDSFIFARRLNDTGTITYGNYFFLHVMEGLNGEEGCKRVDNIDLYEALVSEMLRTHDLEKRIEDKTYGYI